MFKKISKIIGTICLSLPLIANAMDHNIHQNGQVCDMHAFTQYNKYLAYNNIKLIESKIKPLVHLGNSNAPYKIIQFCNFKSNACIKNYKSLQEVYKHKKNVAIYTLYLNKYNKDQNKIHTNSHLLSYAGFSNNFIKKYIQQEQDIYQISNKLVKILKIDHTPAVYIMTNSPTNVNDIYFSEHEDVPKYIINRALGYLQKNNKSTIA